MFHRFNRWIRLSSKKVLSNDRLPALERKAVFAGAGFNTADPNLLAASFSTVMGTVIKTALMKGRVLDLHVGVGPHYQADRAQPWLVVIAR
jgi:hypothetical protein